MTEFRYGARRHGAHGACSDARAHGVRALLAARVRAGAFREDFLLVDGWWTSGATSEEANVALLARVERSALPQLDAMVWYDAPDEVLDARARKAGVPVSDDERCTRAWHRDHASHADGSTWWRRLLAVEALEPIGVEREIAWILRWSSM